MIMQESYARIMIPIIIIVILLQGGWKLLRHLLKFTSLLFL